MFFFLITCKLKMDDLTETSVSSQASAARRAAVWLQIWDKLFCITLILATSFALWEDKRIDQLLLSRRLRSVV